MSRGHGGAEDCLCQTLDDNRHRGLGYLSNSAEAACDQHHRPPSTPQERLQSLHQEQAYEPPRFLGQDAAGEAVFGDSYLPQTQKEEEKHTQADGDRGGAEGAVADEDGGPQEHEHERNYGAAEFSHKAPQEVFQKSGNDSLVVGRGGSKEGYQPHYDKGDSPHFSAQPSRSLVFGPLCPAGPRPARPAQSLRPAGPQARLLFFGRLPGVGTARRAGIQGLLRDAPVFLRFQCHGSIPLCSWGCGRCVLLSRKRPSPPNYYHFPQGFSLDLSGSFPYNSLAWEGRKEAVFGARARTCSPE